MASIKSRRVKEERTACMNSTARLAFGIGGGGG